MFANLLTVTVKLANGMTMKILYLSPSSYQNKLSTPYSYKVKVTLKLCTFLGKNKQETINMRFQSKWLHDIAKQST